MLIGSDECPGQGGGLGAPCPQHWLHPALWLLSLASGGAFWLNSVLCWKKVHAGISSQAAQCTYVCKKRVVFLHNPAPAGKTSAPKLLPHPPSLSPGCSGCCSGSALPCLLLQEHSLLSHPSHFVSLTSFSSPSVWYFFSVFLTVLFSQEIPVLYKMLQLSKEHVIEQRTVKKRKFQVENSIFLNSIVVSVSLI